jgi:hypothetical protein
MNEWTKNERINEGKNERTNKQTKERKKERKKERTNERTKERTNERANERTNEWMKGILYRKDSIVTFPLLRWSPASLVPSLTAWHSVRSDPCLSYSLYISKYLSSASVRRYQSGRSEFYGSCVLLP